MQEQPPFSEVERFQSNLPVERVKHMRRVASSALLAYDFNKKPVLLNTDESLVIAVAGYIIELTENKK